MPVVSLSIVSFNTRDLLRECLASLQERAGEADLEITVVDNGSTDGSVEMVRAHFPQVLVVEAGENLGYGRANNLALQNARGDFVWILNSDTTIEPGAIADMAAWMEAHPKCGAIGSRLILPDGTTQPSCAGDPSLWAVFCEQTFLYKLLPGGRYTGSYAMTNLTDWSYDEPRSVPQVCGASLFVRRETWRATGGFDPSYFMYFEDTDWCVRAREANWEIWFLPQSRVRHHLGASSGGSWRTRAMMVFHYNLGRLLFFGRRRGPRVARALKYLLCLGALARLLAWAILGLHPKYWRRARERVLLFRQVLLSTSRAPLEFLPFTPAAADKEAQ
jgi:GT2 family glycosyltransferase